MKFEMVYGSNNSNIELPVPDSQLAGVAGTVGILSPYVRSRDLSVWEVRTPALSAYCFDRWSLADLNRFAAWTAELPEKHVERLRRVLQVQEPSSPQTLMFTLKRKGFMQPKSLDPLPHLHVLYLEDEDIQIPNDLYVVDNMIAVDATPNASLFPKLGLDYEHCKESLRIDLNYTPHNHTANLNIYLTPPRYNGDFLHTELAGTSEQSIVQRLASISEDKYGLSLSDLYDEAIARDQDEEETQKQEDGLESMRRFADEVYANTIGKHTITHGLTVHSSNDAHFNLYLYTEYDTSLDRYRVIGNVGYHISHRSMNLDTVNEVQRELYQVGQILSRLREDPVLLTKAELEQWYACEPNPDQEAEEGPTIEGPAP